MIHLPMTEADTLRAEVLALFNDVPSAIVNRAILDAATNMMQYIKPRRTLTIPVQKGVAEYDINKHLPDGIKIATVYEVKQHGCCLQPMHECQSSCTPAFDLDTEGWLELDPPPGDDGELELTVELMVDNEACRVPQVLMTRYRQAFKHAVWAELYGTPSISDDNGLRRAQVHAQTAKALITEAVSHRATRGKAGLHIQRGERVL